MIDETTPVVHPIHAAGGGAGSSVAAPAPAASAAALVTAEEKAALKTAWLKKAEGVFNELNQLFVKDPNIDELSLVFRASMEYFSGKDVSGVDLSDEGPPFLVVEHKLGVTFWCVPYVLKYAQRVFEAEKHHLQSFVEDANANRAFITTPTAAGSDVKSNPTAAAATAGASAAAIPAASVTALLCSTRALLFVNADNYTAWNARKKLLRLGHVSAADEIRLLDLIFSKHPKSAESWAQRRWVLESTPLFQAASTDPQRSALAASNADLYEHDMFQREIAACERGALAYPQNYYAWTHRMWLMSLIHTQHAVTTELARCKRWTDDKRHHSLAAHAFPATPLLSRCQAASPHISVSAPVVTTNTPIPAPLSHPALKQAKLSTAQCMTCLIWDSERKSISELLTRFSGHETLYAHRRFVFYFYCRLLAQHHMPFVLGASVDLAGDTASLKPEWLIPLLDGELKWAADMIADESATDYETQRRHATAYRLYIIQTVIDLLRCATTSGSGSGSGTGTGTGAATASGAIGSLLLQQQKAALEAMRYAVVPPTAFKGLIATFHKQAVKLS